MRLYKQLLKGVAKSKTKTWETFITLENVAHWPWISQKYDLSKPPLDNCLSSMWNFVEIGLPRTI